VADEIFENSSKIITFIDLAGHYKYMKTTLFGLSSYQPDFTMLLISSNNGIAGTTKEHLGFSIALDVPVFVVLNKIDLCSEKTINETLNKITYLLKSPGCSRLPYVVKNDDDAVFAAQQITESK
jgi:GTPase